MNNKDVFSGYHPIVNFGYFFLVMVFSMTLLHPISLLISLFGAIAYARINNKMAWRSHFRFVVPLFFISALINPLFTHKGATILTYFPNGNPLTMESILYGFSTATMIATVIVWFLSYNSVMTSDKFVYLFGRIMPALALILSMTLCFVPKFKNQAKVVANAQKTLGRDMKSGSIISRAKSGLDILSVLIMWALENAIDTADSMKSRGYGLKGRTAFSIYVFDRRDKMALIYLFFSGAYIVLGAMLGGMKWRYYPTLKGGQMDAYALSIFLCHLALCLMPVILNNREDKKWQSIHYKI